jgi:hypothetical protein
VVLLDVLRVVEGSLYKTLTEAWQHFPVTYRLNAATEVLLVSVIPDRAEGIHGRSHKGGEIVAYTSRPEFENCVKEQK